MRTATAFLLLLVSAIACGDEGGKRAEDDAGPVVPEVPAPKVSKPSSAAIEALKKLKEPRALLFVPPGPVADQVVGYFTELGQKSGVPLEVREVERLIEVEEANRFRVARDGVVVLVTGERFDSFEIRIDPAQADGDLARLDSRAARTLGRLGRGTRHIGLVMHHVADVERFALFKQSLAALNFEVTTVVPGKDVPAGALAIFLDVGAGPTRPAMESIDRHLAAGGAALVAIEPRERAALGPLENRLGVALAPGPLLDPKAHAVLRKDASDLRLVLTSALGAHPSVASLARQPAGTGVLMAGAGALVERGEAPAGATRVVTVRSMPTAFLDLDRNGKRNGREEAKAYPIAVAVSGRFKAVVVASAGWLSDQVLRDVRSDQMLLLDIVRWLAGEEVMATETTEVAATGDQLTSYPLRPSKAAATRTTLWKVSPDAVQGVIFESRGRRLVLERRQGELWGRLARPSPDGVTPSLREFPLGPQGAALFAALAAPVPMRTVGPLDATTRARYALEDGSLTVDVGGGASHTLMIGSRAMGSNDRYAADPKANAVVIISASLIDPLDQGERLALRRLLDLDEKAVSKLVVARGGRTREATRGPGGAWKVPGGGSDEAYLAEEIARAGFRLVPTDFAPADKAMELPPAGRVTFSAGSAPPADLEIFRRGEDEYWIRTSLTRSLVRVSSGGARRITEAIEQLLGPP